MYQTISKKVNLSTIIKPMINSKIEKDLFFIIDKSIEQIIQHVAFGGCEHIMVIV